MKETGRASATIVLICAVWCGFAPGAAAAALALPFGNLNTITTTNQLTNYAASASPASPVTNSSITRSFRGAFSPASLNTRLAIQSDDGSDVFINGVRVLQRKGHVRRKAVGAAYVYRPVMPRIHAQRTALLRLIDTFFGGSTADLVAMARSQSLGSPNGQRPGRHGRARQL